VIERGDAELRAWLAPLVGNAPIVFGPPPPPADAASPALCAHLFDIDRPAAVAPARNAPIEVRLGYLIAAWGADATAAHQLLGRVLTAALSQARYEIELGPSVRAAWGNFDGPARPGFVLRLRVSEDRGIAAAPPVRHVPRIEPAPLAALRGRVAAPDGTPLAGAMVEIEALARTAATGPDGTFAFPGIPRSVDVALRVRAKGHELQVARPANAAGEELLITVPIL